MTQCPAIDDNGFPILPPMKKRDIIERIMTQHWDIAACRCWVCTAGRATGCRPRENHLDHNPGILKLPHVKVPTPPWELRQPDAPRRMDGFL
jgi:hypothetical protein